MHRAAQGRWQSVILLDIKKQSKLCPARQIIVSISGIASVGISLADKLQEHCPGQFITIIYAVVFQEASAI